MTRAKVLVWAGVLALLAVLPYSVALRYPLLRDDRTLLDNSWLAREASPASVFRHHYWHGTRHEESDLYRPLTVLSLAWNLRWAPGRAGLRGVNVALHALAVLVLWWTLARLVRSSGVRSHGGGGAGAWCARSAGWAGAALLAVHPLASEAVLFVIGRAEILAAILGLAAFAVLLGPAERGRRAVRLLVSTLLLALALCCKESAASWVPILLAFWLTQRLAGATVAVVPHASALATWSGVTAAFFLLRGWAVGFGVSEPPWVDNPLALVHPATRAANTVLLWARYLGKMVLPVPSSIEYGYDQIRVVPLLPWGLACALAIVLGWMAIAVTLHRLSPAASFLWTLVAAAFAVTSNLAFPIGTIFAERLAYLPLAALCGLVGYLLWRLPLRHRMRWVLLVVLVLCGVGRTWDRTDDFRDQTTLDEATATASPRAVKALTNAGRTRMRMGQLEGARDLLERAIAIWPDNPNVLTLLGDLHERRGDRKAAEEYRRRARRAYVRWKAGETAPAGERP